MRIFLTHMVKGGEPMIQRRYLVIFVALCIFAGIPAVHGHIFTVGPNGSDDYHTIQEAINHADNGDTITVGPGLYNERITISKSIILRGATASVSKKGYAVPAGYLYDSTTESVIAPQDTMSAPVVTIEKGGVTFEGFIVSMTVAGSYPDYAPTELVRMTAAGNLNNVRIRNNVIGPNTNLTVQNGNAGRMGITVSKWSPGTGDNTVYDLQIRDNKIFDAKGDGCGILMIGAKNTSSTSLQYQFRRAVIDNNEITGNHRSGIDFSAGVQGGPVEADHIRITNNNISYNGWNSTVDRDNIKWGNGIVLIRMTNQNETFPWASRYIDIEGNVFSGNEKNGIYIGPITRDITLENNIIRNNGQGTSPPGVAGYSTWDGIRIDLDEEYQVRERARAGEPPLERDFYDYLMDIDIHENDITGNGGGDGYGLRVIGVPLHGAIDARKNWWGDESGPQNPVFNPWATGDAVSFFVRFIPWYKEPSKSTPVTPPSGPGITLYVGPGNYTTIQEAINAAQDGDTIRVSPGLYDERLGINKSVTLLGATSGVSKKGYVVPPGYTYDVSAESIISPSVNQNAAVVRIETGNVTFDGFIVETDRVHQYPDVTYPETHLIVLNNQSHDYTDVRIENNVIGPNTNTGSQDGTKGRSGIAVYGPSASLVRNLTIARNKIFDARGDGCGIMLLGSVNSTAQTMTSTRGLTGKYQGSVIDSNEITGNHRAGIELNGGTQGGAATADHFRITNNTISNNGWNNTADKDYQKFGNGIMLIHVRSDKENADAWGSEFLDIENNLITDNEKNGIYIGPVNRNITIRNNTIRDNGAGTGGYTLWDGIEVDLDESYHNPVYKNYGYLTNITISENEINASGNYGARVMGVPEHGAINARLNWWGDAGGPAGTTNPTGRANPVSDYVDFDPWYRDAARRVPSNVPPLVATFTATPRSGRAPLTVTFTDTSTGSPSRWLWDFGDNDTTNATLQHPVHQYRAAGLYTVGLTVTNTTTGTNTSVKSDYLTIDLPELPVANFTGTPTTGNAPLHVDFTDLSTGSITSWLWDADNDGTMDCFIRVCNYTYRNPGSYAAKLVVSGEGGFDTMTRTGYITVGEAPFANFSASPLNGTAPLTVRFTDTSSGSPTSWLWDFGDSVTTNTTLQDPVHQYSSAGWYTVRLTVTNTTTGTNTTIKRNYIAVTTRSMYPVASFGWNPFEGMTGETFSFDASESAAMSKTGIRSYRWDFGDGNVTGANADPAVSHAFSSSRVYTVTLYVTDIKGLTNQTWRQISVIARKEPIPLSFNGTNISGEPGHQVITFNTTAVTGNVTNTTNGVTIENPGSGWATMEVNGNTSIDENGKLVVSNISGVVLRAAPSVTELGSGSAGPGNVTTSIDLALRQFVEAPLEVEVTEGANATITSGFQLAAGSGNVVNAIAYTMTIKGSSLVNGNLSGEGEPVRLNMSVSRDWVDSHGGIEAVKVMRYSDDGITKETLETRYLFTAGTPPMCYFGIISPHGLSVFGIASVIPAPPSPAPLPGAVYIAPVKSEGEDSGVRSEMPATVITTARTTVPVTPLLPVGMQQADYVPTRTVPGPEVQDTARSVIKLQDVPASVLFFMQVNLLKMIMLAGAAVIGTALMIWYRQQTRWE
jgi:parallel beta-helix repeat protein